MWPWGTRIPKLHTNNESVFKCKEGCKPIKHDAAPKTFAAVVALSEKLDSKWQNRTFLQMTVHQELVFRLNRQSSVNKMLPHSHWYLVQCRLCLHDVKHVFLCALVNGAQADGLNAMIFYPVMHFSANRNSSNSAFCAAYSLQKNSVAFSRILLLLCCSGQITMLVGRRGSWTNFQCFFFLFSVSVDCFH